MIDSLSFIFIIVFIVYLGWSFGLSVQCESIPDLKCGITEVFYMPFLCCYLFFWVVISLLKKREFKRILHFVVLPQKSIIILYCVIKAATPFSFRGKKRFILIRPKDRIEGLRLAKSFFCGVQIEQVSDSESKTSMASAAEKA